VYSEVYIYLLLLYKKLFTPLHSPNTPSWCGAQLKHRDNITFTFYLTVSIKTIIAFTGPPTQILGIYVYQWFTYDHSSKQWLYPWAVYEY